MARMVQVVEMDGRVVPLEALEEARRQNSAMVVARGNGNGPAKTPGLVGGLVAAGFEFASLFPRSVGAAVSGRVMADVFRLKSPSNYAPERSEPPRRRKGRGRMVQVEELPPPPYYQRLFQTMNEADRDVSNSRGMDRLGERVLGEDGIDEIKKVFRSSQAVSSLKREPTEEEKKLAGRLLAREEREQRTRQDASQRKSRVGNEVAGQLLGVVREVGVRWRRAAEWHRLDQDDLESTSATNPVGDSKTILKIPRTDALLASLLGAAGYDPKMITGDIKLELGEGNVLRIRIAAESDPVSERGMRGIDPNVVLTDKTRVLAQAMSGDLGGRKWARLIKRIVGGRPVVMAGALRIEYMGKGGGVDVPMLNPKLAADTLELTMEAIDRLRQRKEYIQSWVGSAVLTGQPENRRQQLLELARERTLELPNVGVVTGLMEEAATKQRKTGGWRSGEEQVAMQLNITPALAEVRRILYTGDVRQDLETNLGNDEGGRVFGNQVARAVEVLLPDSDMAERYLAGGRGKVVCDVRKAHPEDWRGIIAMMDNRARELKGI